MQNKYKYIIGAAVIAGLVMFASAKIVNRNKTIADCSDVANSKVFHDPAANLSLCLPDEFSLTDSSEAGLHATRESDFLLVFTSTDGRRMILSNIATGIENGGIIESREGIQTKSGHSIERTLYELDQDDSSAYRYHGSASQLANENNNFWFDGIVRAEMTELDTEQYDQILKTIGFPASI